MLPIIRDFGRQGCIVKFSCRFVGIGACERYSCLPKRPGCFLDLICAALSRSRPGGYGSSYSPMRELMNTKWPRQLTANVFSTPSGLKSLRGGNAIPAFPITMSSLSGNADLNISADRLALFTLDKSSS